MHKIYTGRAHGKLLLTAEYLVLDGARALALPCKYGQSMNVHAEEFPGRKVICKSLDAAQQIWFEGVFDLDEVKIVSSTENQVAERFMQLLQLIEEHNSSVFPASTRIHIENKIDFDRQWGLGTSSTLIYNLATWSGVDPYALLEHSFGGSGYDLACAAANGPLVYKRDSPSPRFVEVDFFPPFVEQIYFVYLGKKQNSREGIQNYRAQKLGDKVVHAIAEVEELNDNILSAKTLAEFEESIEEHENIISNIIGMPKVKDLYFHDLDGVAKSLGAWGGDFVMLTFQGGGSDLRAYCQLKGFEIVIPYKEMIL